MLADNERMGAYRDDESVRQDAAPPARPWAGRGALAMRLRTRAVSATVSGERANTFPADAIVLQIESTDANGGVRRQSLLVGPRVI